MPRPLTSAYATGNRRVSGSGASAAGSTRPLRPARDAIEPQRAKHGFSGFAARLSRDEAAALQPKPGVVSVFADPVYQLHTTRSWDFLQQTTAVKIDGSPPLALLHAAAVKRVSAAKRMDMDICRVHNQCHAGAARQWAAIVCLSNPRACQHGRCCYEDNGTSNAVGLFQCHSHAISSEASSRLQFPSVVHQRV